MLVSMAINRVRAPHLTSLLPPLTQAGKYLQEAWGREKHGALEQGETNKDVTLVALARTPEVLEGSGVQTAFLPL